MKLLYLNMIAFGPFTHKRLDFSAGNHGLHIVYGANEAGKSSALRSIRYALYGIPERSSDDFIHSRDKLRIGIALSDNNGKHSEFIRRKGRVNTLRRSDDVSVADESELQAFLSGADELMFVTMFGIDHAALVRGGEEIVRGGGNIGQILFAAGSGISDFRKVQISLHADAEKLFKPFGKNPRINEARSEIMEYQKQLREIRLSASDWALHDETLRNAITQKTAIDADIAEKMRQKNRLERIKNALPVISRRKEMLSEFEPYRYAVRLSQDFGERRRKIITDLKIVESVAASAEKNLKDIREALAQNTVPRLILEHSDMIELFHKKLGEYLKDMLDRPRLQGLLSGAKSEAKQILAGIRSDIAMNDAFRLQLKKSDVLRVQELGALYEKLIGQRESIILEKDRIVSKIEQLKLRLAEIGDPQDSVRELPMPETIESFEDHFRKVGDILAKHQAELDSVAQKLDEIRRNTARLQIEREVPTETDLFMARNNRDELWQTLRHNNFPKENLNIYEQSVIKSDDISDRLRREADRVAQKASLLADAENYSNKYHSLKEQISYAESELSNLNEQWRKFCESVKCDLLSVKKISNITPKEMRAWLQKQIAQIEKDRLRREQIMSELGSRQSELKDSEIRMYRLEQEISDWQDKWASAMLPLGLDKDATPIQASGVLDEYKTLFFKLKEAEGFRKRIDGIDRDTSEFSEKVLQLAQTQAPELLKLPIEQIVMELNDRLNRAREANARMQSLEKQYRTEEKTLQDARQRIMQLQTELKLMCEEAGVCTPDALPDAETRSIKRREIEQQIKHLEETLLKLSAGMGLEEFIRDALSIDPDSIEPQIVKLSEEIDNLGRQKSELDQIIGREKNELSRMDGSDKSAYIAEKIQSVLARMSSDAEQYVRLKLASAVLAQAIERYREKHQGPLLKRSSELFSKMTLGVYDGLQLDVNDKGEAVLVGARALGKDIVRVQDMSTGTADQLYLAVRLASIEAFSEKQETLPFIADDILIQFDDHRACATLEILAELSRKTQVIFFTHHRHLSELAKKHIDSHTLFIHRL